MEDFFAQNAMYVVLIIAVVCWIGIFSYLIRLDRKISSLEQRMKE